MNPSLDYKYELSDALDFRMGVARTLRRPKLRDLTPTLKDGNGTLVKPDSRGNPDTNPEMIWGFDIGLDRYLFDGSGIISANLYLRDFEDKIEDFLSLEDGRWIAEPRNVGNGRLYGAEAEIRSSLGIFGTPNLTAFANATVMHSRLEDKLTGQKRRFDETPDMVSNLGLDYYHPGCQTTFGVNLNTAYGYSQSIPNPTENPGKFEIVRTRFSTLQRLDFSVKTSISNNMSLAFSANNLLRPHDKRVRTTFDGDGALNGTLIADEASYRTFYLRANYIW